MCLVAVIKNACVWRTDIFYTICEALGLLLAIIVLGGEESVELEFLWFVMLKVYLYSYRFTLKHRRKDGF